MLQSVSQIPQAGGLQAAIKELQGLHLAIVTGAAAGTKMDVPAMREKDTIASVIALATGVDDAANCSIVSNDASGTITISGNPVADETFVVNNTTYKWKATPKAANEIKITAGDNTAMAAAVAAAINANENARTSVGNQTTPAVVATAALGVVTVKATADGVGNSPVVVSEGGSEITVSNTDPGAVTATCVPAIADTTTITVNGITFSAKATITDPDLQFAVKADATLQAAEIARVVSAYDSKYATLKVTAVAAAAVVTFSSDAGRTGNSIKLTENSTNVAVSGSGYLAGGTATGGFKSTSALSGLQLVAWYKK